MMVFEKQLQAYYKKVYFIKTPVGGETSIKIRQTIPGEVFGVSMTLSVYMSPNLPSDMSENDMEEALGRAVNS